MSRTTFSADIVVAANLFEVDPNLVEAIVVQESGGHPFAYRPEPRYKYLWDVKLHKPFRPLLDAERDSEVAPSDFWSLAGSRNQEWWAQQASWGLMQVMGAVAREYGFRGPFLPEICRVEYNLDVGIRYLAKLLKQANGDPVQALGAYNAGWGGRLTTVGSAYANSVLDIAQEFGFRP